MADSYKEFDKTPIVDTSDVVIKGFRFRVRELALGVAVVLCLLVIIILAALLGSSSRGGSSAGLSGAATCQKQCFTPPCLQTAAHVTELVNATADPCQDFHSFACGHFPELHPLVPFENERSTFLLMHDRNQERLRRLLERKMDPKKMTKNNYERKLRTFFTSCLDHFTKMQEQGRPLLDQMITPSGGWWVLKGDKEWAGLNYDFQQQLRKVHVDFWTDAFFTFSLITDWLDWNRMTIQIDLSGLGLATRYYYDTELASFLDDYKKYIRTVGGLLLRDSGVDLTEMEKNYRLDTFVNDAFFVESELAKLKRDSNSTEQPHAAANRVKLSDLNAASANAVDWVALFKYMFDKAQVTEDTYVVVLEKEYVIKFTDWISRLPAANMSRILNNYLVWRMADRYDQDLSWDYNHANRQIYVDVTGRAQFLGTWRYCVYKVDQDMMEAMGALFVQNHFSQENKRTAHDVTDYVKTALVDSLRASTWMSDITKQDALKKIEDSIMELGYPDYLTNEDFLNRLYAELDITEDYMHNVVSFNTYFKARWNHRLMSRNKRTLWPYAAYDFVAHYYSPWKQLFLPAGMLQFPVYDHSSPRYTNFGSMGTIVGRQLIHAVDEYGNYYSLDGSGWGTWWSNTTTQRYQEIRTCMTDALKDIVMGPYNVALRKVTVKLNADYYAPLALSESSSVKLAYMAYHKWMDSTGGEDSMPGAKFSNDQMFFISYAQTYCRTRDPLKEYFRIDEGRKPTEKLRINSALSNVPEFQKAFQCAPESKMVAPKRCSFF